MARKPKVQEDTMNDETTNTEAAGEVAKAPKEDKRSKLITVPDGAGGTRQVKRTEYIRELWASGNYDRSAIRDHLRDECTSEDGSHDIVYQIVNAAVKDQEGGPSAEFLAAKAASKEAAKAAKAKDKKPAVETAEDANSAE